ncbi:unnamed protein product, partial [Polarella glacialis]
GLECAIWPHLYWRTDMTETYARSMDVRRLKRARLLAKEPSHEKPQEDYDVSDDDPASEESAGSGEAVHGDDGNQGGRATHQSAKASFLAKVFSSVMGYGSDFVLAQFVYDLWLWTTLGGARNAAGVSMRAALAGRTMSPEYWRTRHCDLIDLQRQVGLPTLFITIAPYEWSAPYHEWMLDEMQRTCRRRLDLPAAETFHLAHLLVQAAKGLITGANWQRQKKGSRWVEHILAPMDGSSEATVADFCIRLEFQDGKRKRWTRSAQNYHGRGTVHLHMLVWLRNFFAVNLGAKISAELPPDASPMHSLVEGSQLSWDSSGWPLRNEPSEWDEGAQLLKLHHPPDAFAKHCRAYMPEVLAALKCHMDVQASDGRSLVLRYVASYNSKFSDSFATEWLRDDATDYAIGRRVLSDYHPLEPEMWMQLGAQQFPRCILSRCLRRFVVPVPWANSVLHQTVQRYIASDCRADDTTLLDYLRDTTSAGQRREKGQRCVVAAIMYSRTNGIFYGQWLLLNVPFRDLQGIWDPRMELVPEGYKHLALCLLKRPGLWRRLEWVRTELELEAFRDNAIENTIAMLKAHTELIDAYLTGELNLATDTVPVPAYRAAPELGVDVELAIDQAAVVEDVRRAVRLAMDRRWPEEIDADAWAQWLRSDADQTTPIAVLGPAGSGKTTAIEVAIRRAAAAGAHVGVATPTGMLAASYRERFPGFDVDTMHGMFLLYKPETETLDAMQDFDLIVVDEVGQLSRAQFERLWRLWEAADRRPALIFVGDFHQLRGMDSTRACESLLWRQLQKRHLHTMRRCKCPLLRQKLELLRHAKPSRQQLKWLLRTKRAPKEREPGDRMEPSLSDVAQIMIETPETMFLTVTRVGASSLNDMVLQALFGNQQPLAVLPSDPDSNVANYVSGQQCFHTPSDLPLHIGMRVTLTKNLNKKHSFVNGVSGVVEALRRNGVQVRTRSGEVVMVYPFTEEYVDAHGARQRVVYYPMRLGYANTLHKVQGATLPHVTVWLDRPNIEAAAYVALSRVEFDENWRFVGQMMTHHFTPVSGL